MHGKSKNVQEATCPACGSAISLRKAARRGQLITCKYCASMLTVTRVAPIKLAWAFEEAFDQGHHHPRHFVEDVHGLDHVWLDEDDYDELEDRYVER